MTQTADFPIPRRGVSESAVLLARTVARWADESVIAGRRAHGESWDELLAPALASLLDDVGLRHLVLDEAGATTPPGELGVTLALALEQVGRADVGLAVDLAATYALQTAALRSGRAEAIPTLASAPGLGLGSLILPGYGEASPGLEGLGAQVSAERRGGSWVLSGEPVRPQCASLDAASFGVVCDLGGEPGLLLVAADAPGLVRHGAVVKAGLSGSRNGEVSFRQVEVGEAALLARGEGCWATLESWYRLGCAAAALGAQLAAFEILGDWTETRVIKGQGRLLRDNPLAAALLGRIGAGLAANRLLVSSLAALLDEPEQGSRDATTALIVSDAVTHTAMEGLDAAMELMGSAGYATEWNLERAWRDVQTLRTYLGPAPLQATRVARRHFGSEPAVTGGETR